MRIAHFGGFAPTGSGLYESARDFVRADLLAGRDSFYVDIGVVASDDMTRRRAPQVGAVDERGGWRLTVRAIEEADDADVWVFHDSPDLSDWQRSVCPIVWVLHGRPSACYRNEAAANGKIQSYSHFARAAQWPRVKVMATMIEEHVPYWSNVLPREKLRLIEHPPIDPGRYKPKGPIYRFQDPGEKNVLIADSWRSDVDIFDTLNAACIAAEKLEGVKFHIFGGVQAKMSAIEPLLARLRELRALGEAHGREPFLDRVYRAVDAVLTPHTIPTRVITEALACGTPVVAGAGCRYTPFSARADDPAAVAEALLSCLVDEAPDLTEQHVRCTAKLFGLADFGARMGELYDFALGQVAVPA